MIAAEFDYRKPGTLRELFELVEASTGQVKFLSGGMTLVPMLNLGLTAPDMLVSLGGISELAEIREEDDFVTIGAMTRHYVVARDPVVAKHVPLLQMAAKLIGDVQVRNRGTLGGSLAHADPAANYLPAVLALNAQMLLASPRGERTIAARDFFLDIMTTALDEDEIIAALRFPKMRAGQSAGYQKFTRVKGNFPIVCAAAMIDTVSGGGTLAIGGVTAVASTIVVPGGSTGEGASELAAVIRAAIQYPIEDQNGDADYKREMAVVFGTRAVQDARRNAGALHVQ